MTVTVRAFPRLHFGLLDLSGSTRRSYGGAGAAFDGPQVIIQGTMHSTASPEMIGFGNDIELRLDAVVARARQNGLATCGVYELLASPPRHIGLGSTTSITLSLLRCMAQVNGWPNSRELLIEMSGRGRTSGVGCNAFFTGGFVVDAGQPEHPASGKYAPSIESMGRGPSLFVGSWAMPADWRVWLMFADRAPTVDPTRELDLFSGGVNRGSDDGLRLVAELYHGLLPAVLEGNLPVAAESVRALQSAGLKQLEISLQPRDVQDLLRDLWARGEVAGLSSFGPAVFAITDSNSAQPPECVPASASPIGPFAWHTPGHELVESGA